MSLTSSRASTNDSSDGAASIRIATTSTRWWKSGLRSESTPSTCPEGSRTAQCRPPWYTRRCAHILGWRLRASSKLSSGAEEVCCPSSRACGSDENPPSDSRLPTESPWRNQHPCWAAIKRTGFTGARCQRRNHKSLRLETCDAFLRLAPGRRGAGLLRESVLAGTVFLCPPGCQENQRLGVRGKRRSCA